MNIHLFHTEAKKANLNFKHAHFEQSRQLLTPAKGLNNTQAESKAKQV